MPRGLDASLLEAEAIQGVIPYSMNLRHARSGTDEEKMNDVQQH